MNRTAFATLALAVLATFLSVPSSAQTGVLQRCDKPLADAEQMSKTITECAAALDAGRASLAAVAVTTKGPEEKVVTTTSSLSVDLTRAAMTEPLHGRLIAHYAYAAFASGDLSQCAPLVHLSDTQELECRRLVADLAFVKARYASGPELVAACRRTDADSAGASASPCCDSLAAVRGSADPCSKLTPKCFDAATCKAYFASTAGDARACRALPAPQAGDCKGDECVRMRAESVANCEADALYAAAFKAKSAAACGASQRCRALMGQGKAVAQEIAAKDLKNPVGAWFLKSGWKTPSVVSRTRAPMKAATPADQAAMKKLEFKGFVCAEPMTSKENRAAMAAVLGVAHSCLADLETALAKPSREITAGIDEREEKVARLSLRLNKYFEGKPAKAPAPAPK